MILRAVSAGKSIGEASSRFAGALNSCANHAILISCCYLVATFTSQVMIFLQEGHWIGGMRPLYARIAKGIPAGPSGDGKLMSFVLDDVNALFLIGAAMLLFSGLKLAASRGLPSSAHAALKPSVA
ncbi:hypothetical protein [Methylobacterium gnaphalii]|uniref:Uncharacterized protein n=1 Tax=Methylobacterium gnaphalii TaxID=1010610 RepID=A0A512JLE3_9HYPH|nr:hypothetical protein [Methylobacterium gnaphalii]GEP10722.1 hypothetical protein MGN01_25670 [Methylobacterium gnaphalii]GJD67406.1 hypothetical protein MMMDOFMJ_0321 [Methylobacterium gnaphalii]GLS49262.1 hypothetical protein GCM10007885_21100 [Methylobacterium gnaphalii]